MSKGYVYLRIEENEWEEWGRRAKKNEDYAIPFKLLKLYRKFYEEKEEPRRKNAKEAMLFKKAKADMKIYNTLEYLTSSLFKENIEELTINKLSKLSKVHYMTVKRFWNEYNLSKWLPLINKDKNKLQDFKYQELAKSLVYYRESKKGRERK